MIRIQKSLNLTDFYGSYEMIERILVNKIQTPDGTVLISHNRHDYKTYTDANGETYMVDGGNDYLRRNVNKIPHIERSVYDTDTHDVIRDNFLWGTYGINGDQPLTYILLKEMTITHIQAIIKNVRLQEHISKVFREELSYKN